jgi:hypothetical protein
MRQPSPHYSIDLDWWFNESDAAIGYRSPAAGMLANAEDQQKGVLPGSTTRGAAGSCRNLRGDQLSGLSDDGGPSHCETKMLRPSFRDPTTDFQLRCGERASRIEAAWRATPDWSQEILRPYYTDDWLTFSAERIAAAHYVYRLCARHDSREDVFRRAVESIRARAA